MISPEKGLRKNQDPKKNNFVGGFIMNQEKELKKLPEKDEELEKILKKVKRTEKNLKEFEKSKGENDVNPIQR